MGDGLHGATLKGVVDVSSPAPINDASKDAGQFAAKPADTGAGGINGGDAGTNGAGTPSNAAADVNGGTLNGGGPAPLTGNAVPDAEIKATVGGVGSLDLRWGNVGGTGSIFGNGHPLHTPVQQDGTATTAKAADIGTGDRQVGVTRLGEAANKAEPAANNPANTAADAPGTPAHGGMQAAASAAGPSQQMGGIGGGGTLEPYQAGPAGGAAVKGGVVQEQAAYGGGAGGPNHVAGGMTTALAGLPGVLARNAGGGVPSGLGGVPGGRGLGGTAGAAEGVPGVNAPRPGVGNALSGTAVGGTAVGGTAPGGKGGLVGNTGLGGLTRQEMRVPNQPGGGPALRTDALGIVPGEAVGTARGLRTPGMIRTAADGLPRGAAAAARGAADAGNAAAGAARGGTVPAGIMAAALPGTPAPRSLAGGLGAMGGAIPAAATSGTRPATGASAAATAAAAVRPATGAAVAAKPGAALRDPVLAAQLAAPRGAAMQGLPAFAAGVLAQAAPLDAAAGARPAAARTGAALGGLTAANPLLLSVLSEPPSARPPSPALVEAAGRLPGPIGRLLAQAVGPVSALETQRTWEAAVLGGAAAPGADLAPVWQRWGLGGAGPLESLVQRLTGQPSGVEALANSRTLPSQVVAGMLGVAVPESSAALQAALAQLDPRRAEAALLGLGSPDGAPGLNGLVRLAGEPATVAGAVAFVAAGAEEAPLLLALLRRPDGQAPALPLGAGLQLQAALAEADGAPASAAVGWGGPAPATPGRAASVLSRVAQAVLGALAQGRVPEGIALQVPLMNGGPAAGTVRLAGGGTITLGADPARPHGGNVLAGVPPLGVGVAPSRETQAMLMLGSGVRDGGWDRLDTLGAHVRYEERRPVPLDVAPERPGAACWRLDDTGVSASVGKDGVEVALARARRLHGRLSSGKLGLDGLAPGHGIDTWDGSPAWLALAGVAKAASLGVLPGEASPPRLDVSRAGDGTWLVVRRGGAEGQDARRPHPADAAESIGLFQDVVFGLSPDAVQAPPGGEAGALAVRGFRRARAGMGTPRPGRDAAGKARVQEAWAMVARLWAAALDRMSRTGGAGRLSTRGAPAMQAGALREIAVWSGPVPAWHAAHAAGLDRTALLTACDASSRAALAHAVAPAAALAYLLGEPPRGAADPDWSPEARLLATGDLPALQEWGEGVLHDVSEGRPDVLGWGDAVALAVRLGRLEAAG